MQRQQEWAAETPVLDRVNQHVLDQLAVEQGPPIYTLTPDQARNLLLRAQSGSVRRPHDHIEDRNVEWGSHALRVRIIRPDREARRRPVIAYFHGAGWVMVQIGGIFRGSSF